MLRLCLMQKGELAFFRREAEEEEKQLAAAKQKIKSSHDVLNDPHLLKEENPSKELVILPYLLLCYLWSNKVTVWPMIKGKKYYNN